MHRLPSSFFIVLLIVFFFSLFCSSFSILEAPSRDDLYHAIDPLSVLMIRSKNNMICSIQPLILTRVTARIAWHAKIVAWIGLWLFFSQKAATHVRRLFAYLFVSIPLGAYIHVLSLGGHSPPSLPL